MPKTVSKSDNVITCDACPVLCRIRPGRTGACDRYGNVDGALTRLDPFVVTQRAAEKDGTLVPFDKQDWDGALVPGAPTFVTGVGSGTTYPDYKPAPFIVASEHEGVDMVTVVSEGIFSYCGLKVKIDTDRYVGPETSAVRVDGEQIGHVTTAEYGSQMLSLGGVRHLTGGSKHEGTVTCEAMLKLSSGEAVDLTIDGGAEMTLQAGNAPVINGVMEERMRVGCGSAAIGIFAKQWHGHADEVIVVDDHITGVLSEHQAGKFLDMKPTGIRVRGRKSTPGRYFQVAEPGTGWGGTDITEPLSIIDKINPKVAWPGLRLFMVSTTGEDAAYFTLDDDAKPVPAEMPEPLQVVVDRIGENCEPALATVLFMAGAGGSLRAGVTENPVRLTRSVKEALTRVTCGGAPAYVWAGGGITIMVDVTTMPEGSFGYVPTPAIIAPIEFTLPARRLRRHGRPRRRGQKGPRHRRLGPPEDRPMARARALAGGAALRRDGGTMNRATHTTPIGAPPAGAVLGDGRRHFQHGPIDLVIEAFGEAGEVARAYGQAWARFPSILGELVEELALLRQPIERAAPSVTGPVARQMYRASAPHRTTYVTPMAAVAGAVADEVLAALVEGRKLDKAYVNNGGDIAVHLAPGQVLRLGVVTLGEAPFLDGYATLESGTPVRGVATSGWRGRSLSLGIADSVTVLAPTAAEADVAATLIANAVDAEDPAVRRAPASSLDPDSDLGERPVTIEVGPLPPDGIADALDRGVEAAEGMLDRGLIVAALLSLQDRTRSVGRPFAALPALDLAVGA